MSSCCLDKQFRPGQSNMLVHTSRCAGVYLRIAGFMIMFPQGLVELRLIVHGRLGCRDIHGVIVLDLGLVPNEVGRRSFLALRVRSFSIARGRRAGHYDVRDLFWLASLWVCGAGW